MASDKEQVSEHDAKALEHFEKNFSLDVLKTIIAAQNANGLRHRDYGRYRQYCARRLARLRQNLNFKHGRKQFVAKEITANNATDVRFLHILLVNAERAWSYATQMKQEGFESTSRSKFHIRSRLAKAVKWAEKLKHVASVVGDSRTALDTEAYTLWMQANFLLETEDFAKALEFFSKSKATYEALSEIGNSEQRVLCLTRIQQIEPSIRYCKYLQSPEEKAAAITVEDADELLKAKIENLLQESRKTKAASIEHIQWGSEKIRLKNETVKVALLKLNEAQKHLEGCLTKRTGSEDTKEVESVFDSVSSPIDEALGELHRDLKNLGADRTGLIEQEEKYIKKLINYFNSKKLHNSVDRNVILAEELMKKFSDQERGLEPRSDGELGKRRKLVKSEDLVFFFDKIVRSLEDLLKLEIPVPEEVDKYRKMLQKNRIFRLFYRGQSFEKGYMYAEAFVLYSKVIELASPDNDPQIMDLVKKAQSRQLMVQAASFLETESSKTTRHSSFSALENPESLETIKGQPLLNRVKTFYAGEAKQLFNLVDIPPSFMQAPCKPALFDLAFNYVQYPDLTSYVSKPKSSFGFFKFWKA